MKKTILFLASTFFLMIASWAQVPAPLSIKRDSTFKKNMLERVPIKQAPATKNTAPNVYTLNSVKVSIQTGNDNKENGASMIFFVREKTGVWGQGADLFQGGSKSELKVNSTTELILDKVPATTAASYTLENLQARGLYFAVYYSPNFLTDAWKIEAITITLEFKDQYGNLHSSFGNRVVQYNISNGLLTNSKWLLKATADGAFFIPSPVTIDNKF